MNYEHNVDHSSIYIIINYTFRIQDKYIIHILNPKSHFHLQSYLLTYLLTYSLHGAESFLRS